MKRVLVPAILVFIAIILTVVAFAQVPSGLTRTVILCAAGFDAMLGFLFLVFGVPDKR